MRSILSIACASVLTASSAAHAGGPAYLTCFEAAGARYGVSVTLLRAIAKVESNYQAYAVHQDADGTHDVGVMQINSSHFERLARLGISEDTLLMRPCTNIAVGAAILAGFIAQFGTTWRAVGSYAAGTHPAKEGARVDYVARVQRAFDRISADASTSDRVATGATPTRVASLAPVPSAAAPGLVPRMQVLE